MAGRFPVMAAAEQKTALQGLAQGSDRAEADRARALLLTPDGWTVTRIAQAFGVREDCARIRGGFGAAISPGAGSMP